LQLAELNVRAGADQVSLARANRWEDIGIGVFVEGERFRDEPEGIVPEALVGVHFSVPLPLWQNGSGKVAEMEAAKARQQKTAEALRSRAKNEAVAARANLVARFRAASQIESILLPSARKQVAETEAAYARGEADVQDVFRARKRLAEIESTGLEARKNTFCALSEWIGTLGEPTSAK
jgi:outer membrane protein TolC